MLGGVQIQAREIGRQLVITVGGPEDGMTDEERAIAETDVARIVVPPVTAEVGLQIWAYYAGILFGTSDASAESEASQMTRLALGAWWDEDTDEKQRGVAEARWRAVEALRWEEGEQVCQLALYWNAQGGGMDAVRTMLEDGNPKAQELLLTRNQLWNVYSRMRMLNQSPSSEWEIATPSPDGSSGTNTPSGTSEPAARDAFGLRLPVSDPLV